MKRAKLSTFERLVLCRDSESSADLCWLWMGARDRKGYGHIKVDGKNCRVHIVAFELATGRKLRPGHTVEHTCRNPSCWRPSHLDELTRSENTARGNRANPRSTEKARAARRRRAAVPGAPFDGHGGLMLKRTVISPHVTAYEPQLRGKAPFGRIDKPLPELTQCDGPDSYE